MDGVVERLGRFVLQRSANLDRVEGVVELRATGRRA
jgi:hypothetical protein